MAFIRKFGKTGPMALGERTLKCGERANGAEKITLSPASMEIRCNPMDEITHVMRQLGLDHAQALRHVRACAAFRASSERRNPRPALTTGAQGPPGRTCSPVRVAPLP